MASVDQKSEIIAPLLRSVRWHQKQTNRLLAAALGHVAEEVKPTKEPSMTRRITEAVMASCAGVLIGWDVYVALNGVPGDTISELTLGWALQHPVIPLAVGILCGHLFWPQKVKAE